METTRRRRKTKEDFESIAAWLNYEIGFQQGKAEVVTSALRRQFGTLSTVQSDRINCVNSVALKYLIFDSVDFQSIADLDAWLTEYETSP